MKELGLTETKLFHFHRILKMGGGQGWCSSEPPPPPRTRSGSATGVQSIFGESGKQNINLLAFTGLLKILYFVFSQLSSVPEPNLWPMRLQ